MGNDFSSFDVREKPMVTADSIVEKLPHGKKKKGFRSLTKFLK
jgi:hypothetical protein